MLRNRSWIKTILAMLAGAILTLAVQGLSERWSRHAEASTLDQLARQTMANLLSSLPWTGKGKIRGVAGLGDGRTFIIYTDDNIYFYGFGFGPTTTSTTP
jgi:hypothetical protein